MAALEMIGWQVGLTYQAPYREGLSREYLLRLLDEMQANGMNLLSLMMVSQAYHDPEHDGYAWPVRNKRLQCYVDSACLNAKAETEFVSEVIQEAAERGIAVQLFLTGTWWTAGRIRKGYPQAQPLVDRNGQLHPVHFCLDSPDTWEAWVDEVSDLLTFYRHPNVRSFGFEIFGFPECYCSYTKAAFRRDFGRELENPGEDLVRGLPLWTWNVKRTRDALQQFVSTVHQIRPDIEIWLHTQGVGNGHMPHIFRPAGITTLLPLDHYYSCRQEAWHLLQFLQPNLCVIHLCARATSPANYPIPPKDPELIREKISWYLSYPGENLRGIMFFNDPAVPLENKQAIYSALRES